MGKYGKKTRISKNLEDYMFILEGEAGVGKTTTMAEFCERYIGEDGYIILDMGKEQGMAALDGYNAETCEDYEKFIDVVTDIIENKEEDYPDLKLLVIDTLDQLVEIYTPYVIDLYNKAHRGDKGFKKAQTLNAAWGGFGAGEDKVSELILDKLWELKKVGVGVWFCGHIKTRNKIDPITQMEYAILSTNLSQRIFEAFKTKAHFVGIACIDRTIEEESTGRKNIVTKQEIKRSKIKKENRKIVFRDDSYSVDAKSRFADIAPEIPMDVDALYTALTDAIERAIRTNDAKKKPTKKRTSKKKAVNEIEKSTPLEEVENKPKENIVEDDDIFTDEPKESVQVPSPEKIKEVYNKCEDPDRKQEFKTFIKNTGKGFGKLNSEERIAAYEILTK